MRQKCVLLGFVEAMNFVNKQQGSFADTLLILCSFLNNLLNLFYP
jgi:hypothetical protein